MNESRTTCDSDGLKHREANHLQTWRMKDGRPIHDGDCYFWGRKVCTCGLLHHLQPNPPEDEWFWTELAEQEQQLRRMPKAIPLYVATEAEMQEATKLFYDVFGFEPEDLR